MGDLDQLISQLPTPFVIMGDLNAHNTIWGGDRVDPRGRMVEDFLANHHLCLWNDGRPTYVHPGSGSQTSIDLSICHPHLLLDYQWSSHEDTCGSDHFPLVIRPSVALPPERIPAWLFHKADWDQFRQLCLAEIVDADYSSVEDPMELFTTIVDNVAFRTIPKGSPHPKHSPKPWFDEECKQYIKSRSRALNIFRRQPTPANLADFRLWQARTRRLIKAKKRQTWKQYVSKLTCRTPLKQAWNMVRKIIGKANIPQYHHLSVEGLEVTEPEDISNVLGQTFAKHSSSGNYSREFQQYKTTAEQAALDFHSSNQENYNCAISLRELKQCLGEARDTSPGPDGIPYQILRMLPDQCLTVLLDIFNHIWETNNFPQSWRRAMIIPIPKPGKDCSIPANHRPIALTSCLCKTMERIINKRLVYYLESNNMLTNFQCGFRQGRSTLDHIVRMETIVRNALIAGQHLTAVFFDLEKAYDTTWKFGILRDLHQMGLRGNLPTFIQNFLDDRTFQVRLGTTLSDVYEQEMGVPQGSVLSVTLFSIKINSIVNCLHTGIDCSLYVDDFVICYKSSYMPAMERQLQTCLNKLENWADENGFKFSQTKTVAMHFCKMRRLHPDPELFLKGTIIPVVPQTKFLGVIFDRKLTFIPHLKNLKLKCQKALNLLKVVGHFDWGADRKTLLALYRSLVRSKLDYGSIVYGSARRSYRSMLDPIQNQALRICLGAFRTSPAVSLCVEANEPPLELRRIKLSLQYALKLRSDPYNPAFDCVFSPTCEALYEGTNHIPPFGLYYKQHLEDIDVDLENIKQMTCIPFPPWEYNPPCVDMSLADSKKDLVNPVELRQRFLELRDRLYKDRIAVFTDGSKAGDKVAAAAVVAGRYFLRRLPDKSSVYSAELTALGLALQYIGESSFQKFLICSDSLSCLQALQGFNLRNPLLQEVIHAYRESTSTDKDIVFCWVPSHVGISGNEVADFAAKAALSLEVSDMQVPYTDFKAYVKPYVYEDWQSFWNLCFTNKLHEVQPTLGEWVHACRQSRREEVVLTRIRIGHTRLTHSYLLKGEPQPRCDLCTEPLTIKHILMECQQLHPIRRRFYSARSMQTLFDEVNPKTLIQFLKHINVYYKL